MRCSLPRHGKLEPFFFLTNQDNQQIGNRITKIDKTTLPSIVKIDRFLQWTCWIDKNTELLRIQRFSSRLTWRKGLTSPDRPCAMLPVVQVALEWETTCGNKCSTATADGNLAPLLNRVQMHSTIVVAERLALHQIARLRSCSFITYKWTAFILTNYNSPMVSGDII